MIAQLLKRGLRELGLEEQTKNTKTQSEVCTLRKPLKIVQEEASGGLAEVGKRERIERQLSGEPIQALALWALCCLPRADCSVFEESSFLRTKSPNEKTGNGNPERNEWDNQTHFTRSSLALFLPPSGPIQQIRARPSKSR
jgi:hypothetical protein